MTELTIKELRSMKEDIMKKRGELTDEMVKLKKEYIRKKSKIESSYRLSGIELSNINGQIYHKEEL